MAVAGDCVANRVVEFRAMSRAVAGWPKDALDGAAMTEQGISTYPRTDRGARRMDAQTTEVHHRQPGQEATSIQVRDSPDLSRRNGWQGDPIAEAFCFLGLGRPSLFSTR